MPAEVEKVGYAPDAIANEFLSLPAAKGKLSPMKIQKLVYYAHGWHLALADSPLVYENVEAWKYGPVFPSLYATFRDYGSGPITELAVELSSRRGEDGQLKFKRYNPRVNEGDERVKGLIQRIWDKVGHYSPTQLSSLTHQPGTPWHTVISQFQDWIPQGVAIPNELIQDYFRDQLKKTSK